ncbi:amino acid adenylation domain-containing protein [Bradyrhizobium ontarionense]|uniref:Amino acid adenylation domain-containing protein n=1 Tax=Bradyrhizobium ontarionense TaxID=2898149 RepID=A0ABY3RCX8_9BRAD|nr:non-ribosomal peptide synthetase [Bradyrhizobium sp. A19]UFZ04928.1 amino acid adenylation domain-containing protein [Bradyrhizobium sp. A19]
MDRVERAAPILAKGVDCDQPTTDKTLSQGSEGTATLLPGVPDCGDSHAQIDGIYTNGALYEDETEALIDNELRVLRDVWKSVLGLEHIDDEANFLELGGDSLLSIQVATRAKEAGIAVQARQLFQTHSVKELVAAVSPSSVTDGSQSKALQRRASPCEWVTSDERDVWLTRYPGMVALYPMTGMQRGLLFQNGIGNARDEQAGPGAYAGQMWRRVAAGVERDVLKAAWNRIVERHAILRTIFVGFDREQPLQLVLGEAELEWRECDLSNREGSEQPAFVDILRSEIERPFNFERPPFIRIMSVTDVDQTVKIVLTYHHCVLDGWSILLLWNELSAIYEAECRREPHRLPSPVSYEDYVQWRLHQPKEPALEYWRKNLAGLTRAAGLPQRNTNGKREKFLGRKASFTLNAPETARLMEWARGSRVTIATVVQASWAYAVSLLSGERDIVFGLTSSGRSIELDGVESIVGLLIETVPVRILVDPECELGLWLQTVQDQQVERERYAGLDLVTIRKCGHFEAVSEMFDALIVVESFPQAEKWKTGALQLGDYNHEGWTHYDLTLVVTPDDDMEFLLYYNGARFGEADVTPLLELLERSVTNISRRSANDPVAGLWLPEDHGSDELLEPVSKVCRQGELRLGRYLVHQLVENQAERDPDKIAVVHNGKRWTYGELNRAANCLANHLLAEFADIKPDTLIGLMLPRSDMLIIAILAVWKVGAAYVPLDRDMPANRLRTVVQDSKMLLVIKTDGANQPFDGWRTSVVDIDSIGDDIDRRAGADRNPDINVSGSDLAYVIYTSGSTGGPKGVMIEHMAVLNNILNKTIDFGMTERSVVAQNASPNFDISVWQMFAALTAGGTTVVYSEEEVFDVARFAATTAIESVSVLELVPSYLILLVEHLEEHAGEVRKLRLEVLVLTGETVDAAFVNRWWDIMPTTCVVNAYGPTEAGDDITHHVMSERQALRNPVPIGKVLANFDVFVVDENLLPVATGEKGEIVVAGAGVGRGYLNASVATNAAFVKSPFPDKYRGRLYRTGDIGQMLPDGSLLFHGRKDRQVKVHGHRIELEEIERALLDIDWIKQAAVIDVRRHNGDASLSAFVVGVGEGQPEAAAVSLRDRLPHYMIPAVIQVLTELPKLENGKVDRNALRDMVGEVAPRAEFALPSTDTALRLARIIGEVVGVERVGELDDFFDLGGDSFMAIRVAAKYGPPLEVTDIYNLRTVGSISCAIELSESEGERYLVPVAGTRETAKVVVVGIANSGGDPISFHDLGREIASRTDDIALLAVKLPRILVNTADEMLAEIERITRKVIEELTSEEKVPVILFGQCNGSALAISIAIHLCRQGDPVGALAIGGALFRSANAPTDLRSDAEILEGLRSLGASLPRRPDEVAFFLNDFRYDCRMADAYYDWLLEQRALAALGGISAPVCCIVGSEDAVVPNYRERYSDWGCLSEHVGLVEYEDRGHYLLRDCAKELADTLIALRQGAVRCS